MLKYMHKINRYRVILNLKLVSFFPVVFNELVFIVV